MSRAELVSICWELKIECKDKSIDEMKQLIREFADKNFKRRSKISGSKMSLTLRKFLSKEYDFKFYNKNKEEVDYRGNKI